MEDYGTINVNGKTRKMTRLEYLKFEVDYLSSNLFSDSTEYDWKEYRDFKKQYIEEYIKIHGKNP